MFRKLKKAKIIRNHVQRSHNKKEHVETGIFPVQHAFLN